MADGDGRNGVWLAEQGYRVTAVDSSSVGLAKARRLADSRGVGLETRVADLADFDLGEAAWDGIVSIFCHLPAGLRRDLHRRVVRALRPGGVLLLEAYTPRQLGFATGGPSTTELMMELESLRDELDGLELEHAVETERAVHEGRLHHGRGAVVQLLAVKKHPD